MEERVQEILEEVTEKINGVIDAINKGQSNKFVVTEIEVGDHNEDLGVKIVDKKSAIISLENFLGNVESAAEGDYVDDLEGVNKIAVVDIETETILCQLDEAEIWEEFN